MKKKFNNNMGFTLMEMVMVLVVVGLLVSIIVPKFTMQLDNAKEAASRANLESLRAAVGLYNKQYGFNPPSFSELVNTAIIRELPNDAWGFSFAYSFASGEVTCSPLSIKCLAEW